MARLILATAEGQQAIELRPINSLGRHPNNSIQLLDKIVSKEHCIVEQRDGHFVLRDLGSLNGTYINGERVRGEQFLRHGDEIALGSTRARYDDGSGAPLYGPSALSPGAIQQPLPPQQQQQPMPPQVPAWPPQPQQPASMMQQQQPGMLQMPPMQQQGMPPSMPRPPQAPPAYPPMPPQQGGPLLPTTAPMTPMGTAPPLPGAPRPRPPSFSGTRVDVLDSARAIGTQIAAQAKGFVPFEQIAPKRWTSTTSPYSIP